MVVTRDGTAVHPCIKEIIFVSGISDSIRPITRRVAELPSLRYGSIGAKTIGTGPLRVTDYYPNDTIPKRTPKKINNNYYSSDENIVKSLRRVRFNLPPSDDDAESVTTPTAGERRARSRVDPFSQRSNFRRADSVERRRVSRHTATHSIEDRGSVTTNRHRRRRTLSPTSHATPLAAASPAGQSLLRAARDGDDLLLKELLRRALLVGIAETDLNAIDSSGRTVLSYVASNGSIDFLEQLLQLPHLNPNKADNEGNTPLHFAAQAGQVECLNCMLSRCRGIEIDARNNLGFTPLMKAALQGRNKCAKLLLFAGANPTLRDNGRGFRADQWARFCGRYVCADVIEKHARQRLLERSTSYGNWGGDSELGARVLMGKVMPMPAVPPQTSHGLRSKLKKVFRTSSGLGRSDSFSSARLVTQLTSAALCASTPVLPSAPAVPPVVKSLIRPLTVPRLQITLANGGGNTSDYHPNHNNNNNNNNNITNGVGTPNKNSQSFDEQTPIIKPARSKKKK